MSRKQRNGFKTKWKEAERRHMEQVLAEYPSAWFNAKDRTIEGYTQGLVFGRGSVLARSIEASAWRDAAKNLKKA